MNQQIKHLAVISLSALLSLTCIACGKTGTEGSTESTAATAAPAETAETAAPAQTAEPAAASAEEKQPEGVYNILGLIMDSDVVMTDALKGNYLDLKADGTGTLYFGETNNGPISSWSVENGTLSLKAGVSEFTGSIEDGIMKLNLDDDYVLLFAKEDADTSAYKVMTLEEYKAAHQSGSSGSASADYAGTYELYALESQGRIIKIPDEDKNSLVFVLESDGSGKLLVEDESEPMTWTVNGKQLFLYEADGKQVDSYEMTIENGIIQIIVPPDEDSAEVIEYLVTKDADVSGIKITG